MEKEIQFLDKKESIMYFQEFEGLKDALGGKGYRAVSALFIREDLNVLFNLSGEEFVKEIERLSYGFKLTEFNEIKDDLELKDNHPFVKKYQGQNPSINWMSVQDVRNGVIYYVIKPQDTNYEALKLYLKEGNFFMYSFSIDGEDYVVILWREKPGVNSLN